MSVVNKMLQDLEQRQNQAAGASSDYRPPAKASVSQWMLIILLLIAITGAAFWWFSATQMSEQPVLLTEQANLESHLAEEEVELESAALPMIVEVPSDSQAPQPQSEGQADVVADQAQAKAPPTAPAQIETSEHHKQPSSPELTRPGVMTVSTSGDGLTIKDPRAEAQFALQKGDTKTAIDALFDLLEQEPENIGARKKLASLLFAEGQAESAQSLLESGLKSHPNNSDLHLMLARLYSQNAQPDAALQLLQQVQVYAVNDADFIAYRASLAKQLNQHNSAYQDYLALAKAQPEQARWWLGFAVAAERLEQLPSAEAAYDRALSLNQLSAEVTEFIRQRLRYLRSLP